MGELVNRSESTKRQYLRFFNRFCEFTDKSPDQLIKQRKEDLSSDELRVKREIESDLKKFIAHLEGQGFSISSQQNAYASVRSFFEMHYLPLQMRKSDYPSGESIGHRAATKKDIQKILEDVSVNVGALILFLKDCGLRVGDVARLKIGDLQPGLDNGYEFIPIKIITKKNRVQARTWIGPEATEALRAYIGYRRRGTRRIPAERVTNNSTVFRARSKELRPLSRSGMSSIINYAIKRAGLEGQLSAHSFRKFFQTRMESAGVNPDWIDHMVGRKLPGVRTAYSQPTTHDLFHSYQEAYNALQVFDVPATQAEFQRHEEEIRGLRLLLEEREEKLHQVELATSKEIIRLRKRVEKYDKMFDELNFLSRQMILNQTMSGISQGPDRLLNILENEGILTELYLDNLARGLAENYDDKRELEKVRNFIEMGRKRLKKK